MTGFDPKRLHHQKKNLYLEHFLIKYITADSPYFL